MARSPVLWVLFVLCVGMPATCGTFSFRHGPLGLIFDASTGALLRVALQGETLAESAGPWPFSFGIGPSENVRWAEQLGHDRKLVKRAQPSPDTLELTVRVGPFEVLDRYRLHAGRPRLDRSATLTNRGTEAVKLRGFAFHTPAVKATADGFYRFPGKWPPRSHPFREMKTGTWHGGRGSIAPAFAQLGPKRSLVWASCTTDSPSVRVTEEEGSFRVSQSVQAAGYLRPGQPQQIGFVTVEVVPAAYWDALPHLWQWMDSVGIKTPTDRPRWVEEAILYEFHPGGTIGSGFRDLGGFKAATEKLLPTLPKLGVNAIWIQPIEYRSPYWPLDYYRFMDGLGTADEYKALVAKAHELGLKVIQDIVPHGGAPHAVHNKAHPEFMLRREDGSHLDYWLNDFARPDWQDFIGKVAAHYVREYGVDGYRIDACYGSKELNWSPKIPYARASHARLKGGLAMVKRIRDEVRKLKPKDGAVLAEVESARHAAVSDFQYDFALCYNVLHQWRKMPAADFVPLLQDYLEEQKYVYPRGTLFLRHIESHDSLRAQGWYGVEGMRALYALTAWIQGVPLIYLDQDIGHYYDLRRTNLVRNAAPELSRGAALYRAVSCDLPGVFTCLRRLGDRVSVVAINFSREHRAGEISWPGGKAIVNLAPLDHIVHPYLPGRPFTRFGQRDEAQPVSGDHLALGDPTVWRAGTVEGLLFDEPRPRRSAASPHKRSSIYWRPQGTDALWDSTTLPLHPAEPRIGVGGGREGHIYVQLDNPGPRRVRLVKRMGERPGLHLLGIEGLNPRRWRVPSPRLPSQEPFEAGGARLRVVGPDYIVSNKHFTCVLRRQGGVVRELFVGDRRVAVNHDLYGDQAYFQHPHSARMEASSDVECGIAIWKADDGLHLRFEGQLRGANRFALKRPPLWYRSEYVFTDAPRFTQRWAFRTEKTFKDKTAFLAAILLLPEADRFRFLRDGKIVAEDVVGQGGPRRGETKGGPAPDAIEFLAGGKPQWRLARLTVPEGCDCNVFVHRTQFFVTLLDGKASGLEAGRWYEFGAEWVVGGGG